MADTKELLNGVLAEALNFSAEDVASLYDEAGNPKEEAKDAILAKRSEQVNAEKSARQKAVKDAKDSGLRQKGEEWEKRISKGLGIDLEGATGDDALEKIKQHIEAQRADQKSVDPKDEQSVKNSPFYRKMEMEYAKREADYKTEHETKLKEVEAGFQRKETLRTVRQDAINLIEEMGAMLPKDAKVKANQLRLLDLHLEGAQYEKDGETWIVKDKDGNVIETPQGHAIKYTDFLKSAITDNFELAASKEKSSTGDPTKGSKPSNGTSGTLKKPASKEEAAALRHKINSDTTLDYETRKKMHAELDALETPV